MLPLAILLLSAPAVAFLVFYFALRRRAVPAVVVTGILGGVVAAFLSSAGSAMATSVDPQDAMLRGAGLGFAASMAVAAALASALKYLRL